MLRCKECGKDIKPVRRSKLIPNKVWMECGCEGVTCEVPVHIPDEQIEKYLVVQVKNGNKDTVPKL